jgi:hypothetical protein
MCALHTVAWGSEIVKCVGVTPSSGGPLLRNSQVGVARANLFGRAASEAVCRPGRTLKLYLGVPPKARSLGFFPTPGAPQYRDSQ